MMKWEYNQKLFSEKILNSGIKKEQIIFSNRVIHKYSVVKRCLLFTCIVCLLSGLSIHSLYSQDNTLYYLQAVPQSLELNPALQYRCRVFVEIPVLSSIGLSINSTSAGYHDAVHYGTGQKADSILYDFNNLEKKLLKKNTLKADLDLTLLGFGFAYKEDWYFTFRIYNHTEIRLGYPRDLVALKDGNWNTATMTPISPDLSGIGVNALNYTAISVGASKTIDESLQLGARVKYLMGAADMNSRQNTIKLVTGQNPITLDVTTKIPVNISFPVNFNYDNNGLIQSADFSKAGSNIVGNYIFNKNNGVGIDLGAIYKYDDKITLYASITDLGFIHWGSNVQGISANGSFHYSGLDLLALQGGQQTQLIQSLLDSISNSFKLTNQKKSYFTWNTTKVYAGGTYDLASHLNAGLLAKLDIYDLRLHPSLTASINYTPFKFLAASASVSYMNNIIRNLGLALAIGGPGLQFYIVTDNIPLSFVQDKSTGLLWPYNARTLDVRFGFNLNFGCKQKPKKAKHGRSSGICPAYND
jgi:hypothetical protein